MRHASSDRPDSGPDLPDPNRSRTLRYLWVAVVVLIFLAGCAKNAPQDSLDPAGPIADKIDNLFRPIFWFTVVPIFVLVNGIIIVSVIRFRHRPGRAEPVQVHGNTKLEIGWTAAPALLLLFVAVPTINTVFDLAQEPKGNVLKVDVFGHMWWWEFRYPGLDISTADEFHIPTGRPVRLTMESIEPGIPAAKGQQFAQGVIHSFWVPRLGGKQDVTPGHKHKLTLQADRPGVYPGQCAEYCNLSHANMRLKVIAMKPADFEDWVEAQKRPAATPTSGPAAEGFKVFQQKGCIGCHSIRGVEGAVARVGPDLTHLMSRTTFAGAMFELTPDNLKKWVKDPPAMKPMRPEQGTGMPDLGLSGREVEQVVSYLETLK
jgi:cytochrome c oxidase subunit 2